MKSEKIQVFFTHWKTGEELSVTGELFPTNPNSDRIVVKTKDGYQDIIKSTILRTRPCHT